MVRWTVLVMLMMSVRTNAKLSGNTDPSVFIESLGVNSSDQIHKTIAHYDAYEIHTFESQLESKRAISEYVEKSSKTVFAIAWKNLIFHPDVTALFEQKSHRKDYQTCIDDKILPRNNRHHPKHDLTKHSLRRRYLHCAINDTTISEHWGHIGILQGRVYDQKIAQKFGLSPEALIVEKK